MEGREKKSRREKNKKIQWNVQFIIIILSDREFKIEYNKLIIYYNL